MARNGIADVIQLGNLRGLAELSLEDNLITNVTTAVQRPYSWELHEAWRPVPKRLVLHSRSVLKMQGDDGRWL